MSSWIPSHIVYNIFVAYDALVKKSGLSNIYSFIVLLSVFTSVLVNFYREDGSSTALKTLKRVQKGWGQGSVSSLQVKRSDYLDEWDAAG